MEIYLSLSLTVSSVPIFYPFFGYVSFGIIWHDSYISCYPNSMYYVMHAWTLSTNYGQIFYSFILTSQCYYYALCSHSWSMVYCEYCSGKLFSMLSRQTEARTANSLIFGFRHYEMYTRHAILYETLIG